MQQNQHPQLQLTHLAQALTLLVLLVCGCVGPAQGLLEGDVVWPLNHLERPQGDWTGGTPKVNPLSKTGGYVIFLPNGSTVGGGIMPKTDSMLILCLTVPSSAHYSFSWKANGSTVMQSFLNSTNYIVTVGNFTRSMDPLPSFWGCISHTWGPERGYMVSMLVDATLVPVVSSRDPLAVPSADSFELFTVGPPIPSLTQIYTNPKLIAETPLMFLFYYGNQCPVENCRHCTDVWTCKECKPGYFLDFDGGACLIKSNLQERQCTSLKSPKMCRFYGCEWCNLTNGCVNSSADCHCNGMELSSCQYTGYCRLCPSTISCVSMDEYDTKCGCSSKTSESCIFPCTWCANASRCMDSAIYCTTCANYTDPTNCSSHGCSWCTIERTCIQSSTYCMKCIHLNVGMCESRGCRWSETRGNCYTQAQIDVAPELLTKCNSLNKTACLQTSCYWCSTTKTCGVLQDCYSCALFPEAKCSTNEGIGCSWTSAYQKCMSNTADFYQNCSEIPSNICPRLPGCSVCPTQCIERYSTCPSSSSGFPSWAIALVVVLPVATIVAAAFAIGRIVHRNRKLEMLGVSLSTISEPTPEFKNGSAEMGLQVSPATLSLGSLVVREPTSITFTVTTKSTQETPFVVTVQQKPQYSSAVLPEGIILATKKPTQITLTITPDCTTHLKGQLHVTRPEIGHISIPFSGEVAPSTRLDGEELEMSTTLGEGAFGVVYKGKWRGQDVAIKEARSTILTAPNAKEQIEKEVAILEQAKAENITLFFGTARLGQRLFFITELAPFGSLEAFIKNSPTKLVTKLQYKIALDCCCGMKVLHALGIIHRDLKPDNLLLYSLSPSAIVAKITDFGTSRQITDGEASNYTKGVGTPVFMAPEILNRQPYGISADVYSFGIMLLELVTKQLPFESYASSVAIVTAVTKGVRPDIPEGCVLADTIRQCWSQDPQLRPSFEELIPVFRRLLEQQPTQLW